MFGVGMIGGVGSQEVILIVLILIFLAGLRLTWCKIFKSRSQKKMGRGEKPGRSFDVEAFTRAFVSGELRPRTVEKTNDKDGPLTVYAFPAQGVAIHAHFNDDNRELVGRAEIKTFSDKKIGFVDNYALAMLRHYAEES